MATRNLKQWLSYLEQLHPNEIDMGLARVQDAAQRLKLPRIANKIITVTGTNGKGSTCAFLASLVAQQGLTVGVYSSPHLLQYNERVRINGHDVSDEQLCEAFTAVEQARGATSLTYFEMGTLAAFWLFAHSALDVVILEVGLGGRLDAVNIVDADVAVVTNIGLDHNDWLGDTRDSVAYEKSGIFRTGHPAVCGDLDPPEQLLTQAARLITPLLLRGRDFDLAETEHCWHWRGLDKQGQALQLQNIPLLSLPLENAALALQVYALLDLSWQPEQLLQALSTTRMQGRLQEVHIDWQGRSLRLLLDVAHNPHAAHYLAQRLKSQPIAGQRLAVLGMLDDKDLSGVLDAMHAPISDWAVAALPSPRSCKIERLELALQQRQARVTAYASIAQAIEAQCAKAGTNDQIIIFGSFFTVAEALKWCAARA
ncbi:MAG: bifunctional tetrahydrofolate synthase/dihydrofolate synthase [Pseudomonas sp.]|jgi:dihydrofolate synthase/folylpolyglutamate synthase|nr:bifunctional tetrahydrofolate synthase/dihydrofolate synthase [Pseudomonas sp.]MDD2223575.1 bifunctional tetrahydrofolate synthase/dihydrofolate synthase [Pseudomonas sp.]MDY0414441.1 bifunctional tetrahydrofolate synthase/dihydrofolate synthase [Pseudomonas sp.]NLO54447.1 bifunctional tetrahydrofolate synthase/dihydrofolate synthase [Gammaproteobacteria bacterium]